ncbi:hypothetical protein Scep_019526 [Stephania cephalantha]|uniref:DUF4283 domain-containing protein n=1 Tax=Stephania cephalantha TaxID=152367 RepID=A0AAP0IBH2_9MAGN
MVVVRSAPIHPWSMIEYMLGAGLQRGVTLHPFGVDKALFYCISSQEKEKLISQGKSMGGILIDRIEGWSLTQHSSHQISYHDTWICLECLPINLWNMHTYQSVGSHFGGLVEVASTTEMKAYEQGTWIRVAGDINRFFPGQIEVPCWGTKVLIKIITSVSGKKNGEDEADVDPKADVADLEKRHRGGIADKEDDLEPVIPAAAGAVTGDTTTNEQGVRTVLNSNRGGCHQNAINIRDVQPDRAREDIIQDLQRGRLALSQGQIQRGDTPHPVRASKSLVIRQDDSSPTISEASVHNGSKSDDSTSDGESSPNEYVQDSLDFGEYDDPKLDFDQYESTQVVPAPQDKATAEPKISPIRTQSVADFSRHTFPAKVVTDLLQISDRIKFIVAIRSKVKKKSKGGGRYSTTAVVLSKRARRGRGGTILAARGEGGILRGVDVVLSKGAFGGGGGVI